MRDKKEIINERDRYTANSTWESRASNKQDLIIELLLDLRELLQEKETN